MNEVEEKYLAMINRLPDMDSVEDLLGSLAMFMADISKVALDHSPRTPELAADTTAGLYLASVAQLYVNGCKDVPMASLSARTTMADNFKKVSSD